MLVAALALAALAPAAPRPATAATGALPPTPAAPSVAFGIDGEVFAVARVGNIVYLGGRFDLVLGQARHNLAAVDLETGTLTAWNPVPAGDKFGVRALAASPTGSTIYVAGDFTSLAGVPRAGLGAVSDLGAVTSWNPGTDDSVLALAVDASGSPVYVGGSFTTLGGAARSSLGAVSAAGEVTNWDPGAPGGVRAIVVNGTGASLYVGGDFSTLGGQPRSHVGEVLATTGTATDWDVGADDRVASLALAPSGDTLYLGGPFSSLGGQARAGLGALSTAGTGAVAAWNPGAAAEGEAAQVFALAVDQAGSEVYVGGRFDTLGGEDRTNLGSVTTTGAGTVTTWDPGPSRHWRMDQPGFVFTLSLDDSGASILAGGSFETVRGVPRDSFAEVSTTSPGAATDVDIPVDFTASVQALARRGSLVYVGGTFTRAGALPRRHLAAIDLATHVVTQWAPQITLDEPVSPGRIATVSALAIGPAGTRIYVGGRFDHVNGSPRANLAAVTTGGTGQVLGWDLAAPDTLDGGGVSALALEPGGKRLYVGGGFSTVDGQGRAGLAAVTTGGTGAVTTWDPELVGTPVPEVTALALDPSGTRVFVGGSFTGAGAVSRANVAALATAGTGTATAWAPDANAPVRTLVLDGGNRVVYLGGAFDILGSELRQGLGAVSTTGTGLATAWNPNAAGAVGDDVLAVTLSADRSALYAGGTGPGLDEAYLKAFSTAGAGAVSGWAPDADRPVVALNAADDGTLLTGSTFNSTGLTATGALREFVPSSPLRLPTVAVGDGSVVEGDGAERRLRLTVSLSEPSPVPVSVYAETANGSATEGTDYVPSATWITVPAGNTSAPFSLVVRGDASIEPAEFFRVKLSSPGAARLGRATGIATITDDDPPVGRRVSVGNAAVVEGDAGTRSARFEVSISRAHSKPVTVRFRTMPGTATAGSDFTMVQRTVTIPAGARSTTVRITVGADRIAEPTETYTLRLSAPANAVLGRATGTGRILDDDS